MIRPPATTGGSGDRRQQDQAKRKHQRHHGRTLKDVANSAISSLNLGEKKPGQLLENIFSSKRRTEDETKQNRSVTEEEVDRGVKILQTIFPQWEEDSLRLVLGNTKYMMESAITTILDMEATEGASGPSTESDHARSIPVKNPLPDDFLRLPEDEDDSEEEEEEDIELEDVECKSASTSTLVPPGIEEDDRSEESSTYAEDDGTLYGREIHSDDESMEEEENLPMFRDTSLLSNHKIVADSMNQRFLPAELRKESLDSSASLMNSVLSSSSIDVIKRTKQNISEAADRIKHREPHPKFALLSKASEIYRSGVISSQELEHLRSMILSRIQPSKMLVDMSMSMDEVISDHEWHLLVLKAKGLRSALSVRIIRDQFEKPGSSKHIVYVIRVVDLESGIVWLVRRRFRDFHKLHRRISRLSRRENAWEFPTRRHHGRASVDELAHDRAPVLENFLRSVASLVVPTPLTFLDGCALNLLQNFLDVPDAHLLQRNRTKPAFRELRILAFHILNDPKTIEGKSCNRFLQRAEAESAHGPATFLDRLGDVLDEVQEHMLEHREGEMRAHVERWLQHFNRHESDEAAALRKGSFVNMQYGRERDEQVYRLISDAIRSELEDKMCVPLLHSLQESLAPRVQSKEAQFRARVAQLKGKPQSYFGIPLAKISLSSWKPVIKVLRDVEQAYLPLDKMRKLVAAAHLIHSVYRTERQIYDGGTDRRHSFVSGTGNEPPVTVAATRDLEDAIASVNEADGLDARPPAEEDVLSGDDFLPIFIYVIVHSDLETPILTQVLLNRLCDPEQRRSEVGYYLATYEAALHHILSGEAFTGNEE